MIPVLYEKDEKQFRTYGLGELTDYVSPPEVTRVRNGDYQLYMQYKLDGKLAEKLTEGMKIKSDAGRRTSWQTFEITRVKRESGKFIEVWANHISFRTMKDAIRPNVRVNNGTAGDALRIWNNALVGDDDWEVWSDITTTASADWQIDRFETARQVLGGVQGSILDIWGGEYEFDNKTIRLHRSMGRKAPILLEYGRNITKVEQDKQETNVYTSVYPFARYLPDSGETPQIVTMDGYFVDGKYIDMYDHRKILLVDFSDEFEAEEVPTSEKLRNLATQYVERNEIGAPHENIHVEYADLANTLDYEEFEVMEEVELNDTLPIRYPDFDIINQNAKVVAITYLPTKNENKSIELGMVGQRLGQTLNRGTESRIERIEAEQRQQSRYILNKQGNRVWYSIPPEDTEHKVGDIWFEKNGQYSLMHIWNGSQWIEELNTEDIDKNAKEIAKQKETITEVKESSEWTVEQINQALQGTDSINLKELFARKIGSEDFGTLFYQNAESVGLVYESGGVLKAIIAIQEGVPYIKGEHIILDGKTIVDGTFTVTEEMIAPEAILDHLKTQGINAEEINVINLNMDSASGGTLDLSKGIKIGNNGESVLEVDSNGHVKGNFQSLTINFSPVATQADLEDLEGIEGPPGPKGDPGEPGPEGPAGESVTFEDKDEQSGVEIFTDKADNAVVHVGVEGKSIQDGEPTPDYPIEIKSLNDFDVVSSVDLDVDPNSVQSSESTDTISKINLLLDEPLRSVGDVYDRLYRNNDGQWVVERNVEEYVFSNVDRIQTSMEDVTSFLISIPSSNKAFNSNIDSVVFSHGNYSRGKYTHNDFVGLTTWSGRLDEQRNFMLNLPNAIASTLAQAKAWLTSQASPVTVIYSTIPTTETLPDEQQELLNNLTSYKVSNYVYTTSDLQPTLHATFKSEAWYKNFTIEQKLANLSSGGRNFILGTSDQYKSFTVPANTAIIPGGERRELSELGLVPGDDIVLRVYIDNQGEYSVAGGITAYKENGNTIETHGNYITSPQRNAIGEGFSIAHYQLQEDDAAIAFHFNNASGRGSVPIRYRLAMGERGTTPSDWQPSPEDIRKEFEQVREATEIKDTRNDNFAPSYYQENYPRREAKEIKRNNVIGVDSNQTYGVMTTAYADGRVEQTFTAGSQIFKRSGNPADDTWSDWTELESTDGAYQKAQSVYGDATQFASDRADEARALAQEYTDGLIEPLREAQSEQEQSLVNLNATLEANNAYWRQMYMASGGNNEIRNSVGFAELEFWEGQGNITTVQNAELEVFGSGSAFILSSNATLEQTVSSDSGMKTFSALITKDGPGSATIEIEHDENIELISIDAGTEYSFVKINRPFKINGTEYTLRIKTSSNTELQITNIMVNEGDLPHKWSFANDEIYGATFQMNRNGFRVYHLEGTQYTAMTPDEFAGYAVVGGVWERTFALNGDTTEVNKLQAKDQIGMGGLAIVNVESDTNKGWAVIRSEYSGL